MPEQPSEAMMDLIAAVAIAETALVSIKDKAPGSEAAIIAEQALTRMNRRVPRAQRRAGEGA